MNTPRVSIIMPVYNAEAYLVDAIESVRAQRFEQWELLLVDDGSTDGSAAIVQQAEATDARIVGLRSGGRCGAAAARNLALARATGEFVAFLDADDLYRPDKLGNDILALDADPAAAWVYSATRWFDAGSTKHYHERLGLRLDRRYDAPSVLNRIILEERGDIPCTCGVMIRKRLLDQVGGFEERFRLYEDQSLWVKLLLSHPVRVRSGCDADYRQHAGSTSAAAATSGAYSRSGAHPARDAFLAWIGEYALLQGAPPSVLHSLDIALRANRGGLVAGLARKLRVLSRHLAR